MAGLSDKVELDREDIRRLEGLGDRLGDTKPLMAAIGGFVRDVARGRFREQKGPDGKPWKKSLRAQLVGGTTLVDRGLLRDSYIDRATATEAEVGTADIRARIHHFGGVIRSRSGGKLAFGLADGGFALVSQVTMPARPALGVNDADRVEIRALVADFVDMAAAA
ncbi:phage virion morphogenesis protein [Brevundimonas sp.]|uniref:phage virion morphogenesis protein n=1 Tax=Brevundimonas sp. TaxID=1871086 RepID=UPI003513506C